MQPRKQSFDGEITQRATCEQVLLKYQRCVQRSFQGTSVLSYAEVTPPPGPRLQGCGDPPFTRLWRSTFSPSMFLLIPTSSRLLVDAQAWRRTANAMALLARVAAKEVPDTAAAVRLGGLEVTDAVQELGLLGCVLICFVLSGLLRAEGKCWKLAKLPNVGNPGLHFKVQYLLQTSVIARGTNDFTQT